MAKRRHSISRRAIMAPHNYEPTRVVAEAAPPPQYHVHSRSGRFFVMDDNNQSVFSLRGPDALETARKMAAMLTIRKGA